MIGFIAVSWLLLAQVSKLLLVKLFIVNNVFHIITYICVFKQCNLQKTVNSTMHRGLKQSLFCNND